MSQPFKFHKTFNDRQSLWRFVNHLSQLKPEFDLHLQVDLEACSLQLAWSQPVPDFLKQLQAYEQPAGQHTLFCDGGSRGNPGPGACGFVILNEAGRVVSEGGQFFEHCTNNYAEYQGLNQGLTAALKEQWLDLKIRMDSQLIVKQIKGEYKIKNQKLLPIYRDVTEQLAKLRVYEITFVPRRYNAQADAVVNRILDEHLA